MKWSYQDYYWSVSLSSITFGRLLRGVNTLPAHLRQRKWMFCFDTHPSFHMVGNSSWSVHNPTSLGMGASILLCLIATLYTPPDFLSLSQLLSHRRTVPLLDHQLYKLQNSLRICKVRRVVQLEASTCLASGRAFGAWCRCYVLWRLRNWVCECVCERRGFVDKDGARWRQWRAWPVLKVKFFGRVCSGVLRTVEPEVEIPSEARPGLFLSQIIQHCAFWTFPVLLPYERSMPLMP